MRFRHTDSDLVRNARQQDFIRWAKDQYGVGNLIANRDSLLRTFGKYTQTDHNLRTTDGLLNLFQLVAFSAGHTIKQIKFEANEQLPCGQATTRWRRRPLLLTATPPARPPSSAPSCARRRPRRWPRAPRRRPAPSARPRSRRPD